MVFGFSELTASQNLVWNPCHDNFTCALLEVPLDYSNISVGTINLAIIKKPGESEDAQEVLVNPGGPGGSSVEMVLLDDAAIQDKIGSQYSLVGIDPRGVQDSGPSSDCFPPDRYPYVARNAFFTDVFALADITSNHALRLSHQSALAYGKWCSRIYSVNGTAKYASTVATAQDMLHYIELQAESKGQPPKEAKLWYYGISYGSILGPTFANLYPDRVGRMIIDGVMDLEDYYNGGWEKSIVDSDEAARSFFKRCFEAGPGLCEFHQNATSGEQIEQRYLNLLDALKESPIGLGDPLSNTSSTALAQSGLILTPFVLTWQDFASSMFSTSYMLSPASFVAMDLGLVALQTGNTELLSSASVKAQISTYAPTYDARMARTLIACLDANGRSNYTKFEDYKGFMNSMYNASIYGGLSIASFSGPICSKLDIHPPESQKFDGIPGVKNTSAPILFIGSIADPITPLPAAKKMHGLFPGSGLLVFNNSGHCAHFQKAKCVSKYEKQYMLDATLPPANTTCEVDEPNPWIALAKQYNLTQASA
ncbi:alpha/beta-hydrolase [Cucurbitaria berberidis CBS 394.84]|uniref:Alpha/beta-hydrolase n=1 Tax=Cucurbitaria berberidis CBS 394.84 TaxID=1168544 RepID=A0A9P4GSH3_9PLEO|nr:alpha/beta-hydrolase [Cucurbitaria berberidis CBS 394.84]KAF1850512.1 alpha/beta-hydrolase [Cucurbitaria berberidis CBS 394.84]